MDSKIRLAVRIGIAVLLVIAAVAAASSVGNVISEKVVALTPYEVNEVKPVEADAASINPTDDNADILIYNRNLFNQKAGGDEGDWSALHSLRETGDLELLTDACEEHHSEGEAECSSYCIDSRLEDGVLKVDDVDGNTQNGTVGGDQRKEYTEGCVERRHRLLEDDLYHLNKSCNNQDVNDGLHELEFGWNKDAVIDRIGHQGSNQHNESYGHPHACCSIDLL